MILDLLFKIHALRLQFAGGGIQRFVEVKIFRRCRKRVIFAIQHQIDLKLILFTAHGSIDGRDFQRGNFRQRNQQTLCPCLNCRSDVEVTAAD